MTPATHRIFSTGPFFLSLALASACGDASNGLDSPISGAGANCATSSDCPPTAHVCDEVAGACVECLFDTQCTGSDACRGKQCVTPTQCSTSLDCVGEANEPICDPQSGTCVPCLTAADCEGTADCIQQQCVPYVLCGTSLECPADQVCAPDVGRCVECVSAADCEQSQACVGNECRSITECQSDNQCTQLDQLCDKLLGYCVDCLTGDQCPDAYHCAAGACVLDTCEAGASTCQDNSIVTCEAEGEGWGAPMPCPADSTCTTTGVGAMCAQWVCAPSSTDCDGDVLITCSGDGLAVASSTDCSAQALHCVAGACSEMLCAPNTMFCDGGHILQCDDTGYASTVVKTCEDQEVCDPVTATCVQRTCAPYEPACNGNVATTCNAAGSGYAPGGEDCTLIDGACESGTCVTCPTAGATPANVRLAEVSVGNSDYITLINLGSCPAQLDSLKLRIEPSPSDTGHIPYDIELPERVLGVGETVYVIDLSQAKGDDIVPDGVDVSLNFDSGEAVSLCTGSCSASEIQDYFAHASGAQPPAPPAGITFSPGPSTGLKPPDVDTKSYRRVLYTGQNPSFQATDWTLTDATRPYENPPECPDIEPVDGSTCSVSALCFYATYSCMCSPYVVTWDCWWW